MRNDKIPFSSDYHTDPEKVAATKHFKVRVQLHNAIINNMKHKLHDHFENDYYALRKLARDLCFLPVTNSGWATSEQDIATTAKDIVDCYFAHLDAFKNEKFPGASEAALQMLKEFDFSV